MNKLEKTVARIRSQRISSGYLFFWNNELWINERRLTRLVYLFRELRSADVLERCTARIVEHQFQKETFSQLLSFFYSFFLNKKLPVF